MGIARFYRWMSERYPLINEVIDVDNVPEFDNFYLDMNGIIHHCSHGNTGGQKQASEEHMWLDVFKYVSGLVYRIKPKKLVYLAVDGVAPRAKMNQQRSRRFRAAHDARESREKNEKMNGNQQKEEKPAFDSNCITPGTAFMERLVHHLEFFVQKKLAEDPLWRDLQVVISGPDVPGEGEHKIMDYIRSTKSQPGYDPNTRHCLYGLDADLIMLSLASHEPYFALLREEIDFSFSRTKSKEARSMIKPDKFQLLHVGLLREYLRIDFFGDEYLEDVRAGNANVVGPDSAPERVIDDFIFFCFLVGNDFLPHLPFSEIGEGGLNKFFACYRELVQSEPVRPFLVNTDGKVNFHTLFKFLQLYVEREREIVSEMVENDNWKIGKTRVCNAAVGDPLAELELYTHPDTLVSSDEETSWQEKNSAPKSQARRLPKPTNVEEAIDNYNQIKLGITNEDEKVKHVYSYLEGLQWVFYYYFKGPQSWDWYFPYHYSPFANEIVQVLGSHYNEGRNLEMKFTNGKPFLPFQQLMAVLPPASGRNFLPATLYNLMVAPGSPIRQFYPEEFQIDIDGVKVPWGGVTIIPFVDEVKLVRAIDDAINREGIPAEDARRNREGDAKIFSRKFSAKSSQIVEIKSTLPSLLNDIEKCKLSVAPFVHAPLPPNLSIFPHWVIEGYSPTVHKDFPSLFKFMDRFEVSYFVGSGIRVFNSTSKKESLMIQLSVKSENFLSLEELKSGKLVSYNFPFYSKKLSVLSVAVPEKKIRIIKGREVIEPDWNLSRQEYDVDFVASKLEESGLKIELVPSPGIDDVKIFYSQPVVELYDKTTASGDTVKCLAAIAMLRTTPVVSRAVSIANLVSERETVAHENREEDRRTILSSNVSLNIRNEMIFGHQFERDDAGRFVFVSLPSLAVTDAVRTGIVEILKLSSSVKFNQWQSVGDISRVLGVSSDFVWSVFGEVWIRFGKFQEEVGMNLWSYSSHGEPHCVPGYSKFVGQSRKWRRWDNPSRNEWVFSTSAVNALRDYMRDQPELTTEIRETVVNSSESQMNGGITIQGRRLFSRFSAPKNFTKAAFPSSGRDDWVSEYHLGKIVSYVNSKQFKTLNICNYQYDHVLFGFVEMIERFVVEMSKQTVGLSNHFEDEKNLYPLGPESLRSSAKVSNEIHIGQRGIYVKERGVVEVGSWGTVIGIYGVGRDERIDVLLDKPSLNASSLNGTCTDLRGIRITSNDWRAFPNQFRRPAAKDAEIAKLKNKILADLIVEMEKKRASSADPKHAILAMLGVKKDSQTPLATTSSGTKISVNQLFQSSAALGSSPSTSSAPAARRLQPPTAIMHKDVVAQLNPPKSPEKPEIPEFLLSKLRKQ